MRHGRLRLRVWLLFWVLTAPILAQPPNPGSADAAAGQPADDLAVQRLQAETERLQKQAEDTLQRADVAQEQAHAAVDHIADLAQWTLGGMAVLAAAVSLIAGVVAYRLTRQHRDARRAYRDNERLRRELNESWGRLIVDFDGLPAEELDTVAGVEDDPDVPSDNAPTADTESAFMADHDTLLFIADRLRIVDRNAKTAGYFLRMGRFWRSRRDYCRSLLRIERALEIHPGSSEALFQKAMTLSAAVSDRRQLEGARLGALPELTGDQQIDLHQALRLLQQSDRQRGEPSALTIQQRGFIFDELGDYDRAIKSYRQANDLLPAGESSRLGELITYNLACSLCMVGRYEESLETLERLIGKGPHMEAAAKDPQLAPLREGDLRVRFEDMLQRDRAIRKG